jgi:hypothetical protein
VILGGRHGVLSDIGIDRRCRAVVLGVILFLFFAVAGFVILIIGWPEKVSGTNSVNGS